MGRGEVYLANFPFGGTVGAKLRPVLLLSDPVGPVPEVLVAYMTAVIPSALLPTDIVIDPAQAEYASTGLSKTSVLRLHKLATVHQSDIRRRLGDASPTLRAEVEAKLRLFLNL
jgi:mRNA-degrading endonuclease toxin of MazEF toxin-antitoxin module